MVSLNKLFAEGQNLKERSLKLMKEYEITYDPIQRSFEGFVFITSAGDYRWAFYENAVAEKIKQDLSVWIDFIKKDKKLNTNKVCMDALGKITHTIDHKFPLK